MPVILFEDVAGNTVAAAFSHIVCVVPKLNVGVILGVTVTVKVAIVAQKPSAGRKV